MASAALWPLSCTLCTPVRDDVLKYSADSVAVVGWGVLGPPTSGTPYWVVQNNWGSEWGEGGFLRLRRGDNLFGLEGGSCHVPTVSV